MDRWSKVCSDMLDVCWKIRNNFPVPSSCNDDQLFDFHREMCKGWDQTDERIRNGLYDDRLPTYRLLCEELSYYESKIEDIEYEISRRTWLR